MLAADLRHALNPAIWVEEKLGFELDPLQRRLLMSRAHRDLLNCTRKWGKSTTVGAAATHEATYMRRSKVVVVAPSLGQASILLSFVERFADAAKIRTTPYRETEHAGIVLPCGPVIALPGSELTARGLEGTTWLIIDEAARVPDALFYAVRPFLANTNGRMTAMSTPFGKRGWFYVEHGSKRWNVTQVKATDCPRISPAFLAEERLVLPEAWFRQEYLCEFTSVEHAMFDHDQVLSSLSSEVKPLCL